MMRNSLWTVLIVAVSFLTILSTGCGKKADPRYLHVNYPEAVSDLDVSIDKDGAVLKWSIPGERGRAEHVRILKSALKVNGDNCLNCPRIYAIAEYLPLRDLKLDDEGRFVYLDRNIRSGFSYSYRVVICDSSDMCGDESNTARLDSP